MRRLWIAKGSSALFVMMLLLVLFIPACGNPGNESITDSTSTESVRLPGQTTFEKELNGDDAGISGEYPEDTESLDISDISLDENGMIDVNITVGTDVFAVKFYDNESAWTIMKEMPFTLEMDDYASQEKVTGLTFDLPFALTETPAAIHAGDIYLWSGNSLVLFYTTFTNTYSYVPIGYVVDTTGWTDALGRGSVRVTFDAADHGNYQ